MTAQSVGAARKNLERNLQNFKSLPALLLNACGAGFRLQFHLRTSYFSRKLQVGSPRSQTGALHTGISPGNALTAGAAIASKRLWPDFSNRR